MTLVAAALFVGTVATWLSYAASRTSHAVEDDPRRGPEPQLSRVAPVTVTVLLVVAVVAMVLLASLAPAV